MARTAKAVVRAVMTMTTLVAAFAPPIAYAQSSGNFDAAVNPTVCTLDSSTGNLSPLCSPTADGTECVLLDTATRCSRTSSPARPGMRGPPVRRTPSAREGRSAAHPLSVIRFRHDGTAPHPVGPIVVVERLEETEAGRRCGPDP